MAKETPAAEKAEAKVSKYKNKFTMGKVKKAAGKMFGN